MCMMQFSMGVLFHRAILMSGSALSPWALIQEPSRYAAQVAIHANCSPELPHPHLLKCLRERPLDVLMSTPVIAPDFAFAFGPSVDGVVIDTGEPPASETSHYSEYETNKPPKAEIQNAINTLNNVLLRKPAISKLTRYDLLLGVVKSESYFTFNTEDIQYGIEPDRRSKILRTFVRNTYSYHLSEILATIVNEYTDWEKPVQHPINIRDETLEALSDAQYVAPVVHTADLHSAEHRNSYLYVFDYQTKFGDYPQVKVNLLNSVLITTTSKWIKRPTSKNGTSFITGRQISCLLNASRWLSRMKTASANEAVRNQLGFPVNQSGCPPFPAILSILIIGRIHHLPDFYCPT
ncbi:neuroligin [Rhyzopertha dominica]|nr:neuroligin [Rhyzopertha dominica]